MPEEHILLPPPEEHILLDLPSEEKLRLEVEDLRRQLEQERKKNEDQKKHDKEPHHPQKRTLWIIALVIVLVLLLAFFVGYLPHHRREEQLRKDAQAEANAMPVVSYLIVQRGPANTELALSGNIEAYTEAPVLARADGYLKKRYVDIGDKVAAGQLLAEITAPDLDQQVAQARSQVLQARAALRQSVAALEQARANQALAKVTAARWAALLKRGAVSPQDNDTRQADYQAQSSNVAALAEAVGASQQNEGAAQSNLDRLLELQGYEQVRAPFAGVITLRNIDTGALITTGQTLLFRVAQVDRLRTYINVPEANASLVQTGHTATLSVAEYPGREFQGQITRTSASLDPTTRTLLAEVQIPNGNRALFPGMFAEVILKQSRQNPPVLTPADALIVRATGTFIAVLEGDGPEPGQPETVAPKREGGDGKKSDKSDKQGKSTKAPKKSEKDDEKEKAKLVQQQQQLPTFTVHLAPVTVGRDYGNVIEILTGLNGGERIVANPNDHVVENGKVKGDKSQNNGDQAASKTNANSENLNPQPNAEPQPKQPSKERTNRGPGY